MGPKEKTTDGGIVRMVNAIRMANRKRVRGRKRRKERGRRIKIVRKVKIATRPRDRATAVSCPASMKWSSRSR